jgi:FkbM family methyltransferase
LVGKARTGTRLIRRGRLVKRVRKAIRRRRVASVRSRRHKPPYRDPKARERFFLYRAGLYTPLVGVESDIGLMCVAPGDRGPNKKLFVEGKLGNQGLTLARALDTARVSGNDPPGNGKVFLDVGANIGIMTVIALQRHGFRRAVSVEPEPDNFRLLEANLALNHGDAQVRTFNVAVSSSSGDALLRLHTRMSGKHALLNSAARDDAADVVNVATRTLDDVLAEAGHRPEDVGFLKVDTEGHEPQVFGGARAVLAAGPPVMFEYAPLRYTDPEFDVRRLEQVAAEHYTDFLDLRRAIDGEAELRPISELADLRTAYSGPARVTDVLLIRR